MTKIMDTAVLVVVFATRMAVAAADVTTKAATLVLAPMVVTAVSTATAMCAPTSLVQRPC